MVDAVAGCKLLLSINIKKLAPLASSARGPAIGEQSSCSRSRLFHRSSQSKLLDIIMLNYKNNQAIKLSFILFAAIDCGWLLVAPRL